MISRNLSAAKSFTTANFSFPFVAAAKYTVFRLERAGRSLGGPTGSFERKVRTPQGTVVGNAHRPRNDPITVGHAEGPGKCNRK